MGSLSTGVPSYRSPCCTVCPGWAGTARSVSAFGFFCGGYSKARWMWQRYVTLQVTCALERTKGVSKLHWVQAALFPASWGQQDPRTMFLCQWHRQVSLPVGDNPAARSGGSVNVFPHCWASSTCWGAQQYSLCHGMAIPCDPTQLRWLGVTGWRCTGQTMGESPGTLQSLTGWCRGSIQPRTVPPRQVGVT